MHMTTTHRIPAGNLTDIEAIAAVKALGMNPTGRINAGFVDGNPDNETCWVVEVTK